EYFTVLYITTKIRIFIRNLISLIGQLHDRCIVLCCIILSISGIFVAWGRPDEVVAIFLDSDNIICGVRLFATKLRNTALHREIFYFREIKEKHEVDTSRRTRGTREWKNSRFSRTGYINKLVGCPLSGYDPPLRAVIAF
ncbi:MAG: hypothetical protein QXL15_05140, partial [Candidatus Korarchaeota archaeon]